MADGDAYIGGEAKLYYNSATYDSPTWVLITNSQDLDVPDSRSAVAAPTRGQWPFIGYLSGSRDLGLTWSMLNKKGVTDTVLTAMIAAYDGATPTEFAIADGAIATVGTKFRRIICVVVSAGEGAPLDDADVISFEAKFAANNGGNLPTRNIAA